jgi:acetyltransferase-like isoleucine patch superfamily enzyme
MFQIGRDCNIHPTARINVKHGFIGDRALVREHAVIEGTHVEIGAEAFVNRFASIGGGSCHDPEAMFKAGDFLHMGIFSHLNCARKLVIGHEFGGGVETKVFTHGAYTSAWEGFPVQWADVTIGDNVWLPNAWVNPGLTIGSNVVVASRSLVNKSLPAGCLAGGNPAVVLKENRYPRRLSGEEKRKLFVQIFAQAESIDGAQGGAGHKFEPIDADSYRVDRDTVFHVTGRRIEGRVTKFSETLRNQLRRNGIRFRYLPEKNDYVPWKGVLTSA